MDVEKWTMNGDLVIGCVE